mgnify:FL=1
MACSTGVISKIIMMRAVRRGRLLNTRTGEDGKYEDKEKE